MTSTIKIYLDTGQVFKYVCSSTDAREHVSEIIFGGYRRVDGDTLIHFPPHRIRKIKAVGGQSTNYKDTVEVT